MKVELDIDAQDLEDIGVDFVKESYIGLLSTLVGLPDYKTERELFDIEEELIQDQQRLECFETVLKYILPKGEAHAFIAAQHHTFSEQIDLFN
jgi:hypothetical protein